MYASQSSITRGSSGAPGAGRGRCQLGLRPGSPSFPFWAKAVKVAAAAMSRSIGTFFSAVVAHHSLGPLRLGSLLAPARLRNPGRLARERARSSRQSCRFPLICQVPKAARVTPLADKPCRDSLRRRARSSPVPSSPGTLREAGSLTMLPPLSSRYVDSWSPALQTSTVGRIRR